MNSKPSFHCLVVSRRSGAVPLLGAILFCAILTSSHALGAPMRVLPGARWEEATPESQGVDTKKLEAATRQLAASVGSNGVQELAIIRHGRRLGLAAGRIADGTFDLHSRGGAATSPVSNRGSSKSQSNRRRQSDHDPAMKLHKSFFQWMPTSLAAALLSRTRWAVMLALLHLASGASAASLPIFDRAAQDRLLKERIQREVRAYRDVDIVWDMVNEAIHCRKWGAWDRPGYTDEPISDVVPYVRDALRWAREANPQARLLINDYRVITRNKYRDRYVELIGQLQADGAPLNAIGIQAHEPNKGAYWFSPEEVWAACEQFGTHTGLPILFTEFCYTSDPAKDVRGGTHRQGKWSPEKQAEAIEEFYRVAFGHPAVQAIIYFGMGDNHPPWLPKLCLMDERFQPKPSWERLRKLIKEEWNTQASGFTDEKAAFTLRGFHGRYEVRVTDGGKQQIFNGHLEKGKPNNWRFTLE